MTMIKDVEKFMIAGDQFPNTKELQKRQTLLYLGLQVEELSEKLEAVGLVDLCPWLDAVSINLKQGTYDSMCKVDSVEALDADLDLIWVTIGAMLTRGADVEGGWAEVARSNMSKVWEDGTMHKNEFGKIMKPPTFSEPQLRGYINEEKDGE